MVSPLHKRKRHRITTQISTTSGQQTQKNSNKNGEDTTLFLPAPNFLILLLRRLGLGLIAAIYACTVLTALMVVSVLLGFGIVVMLAEEPVFVKERVYFDYAEVRPVAVMRLRESRVAYEGVPIGHSFYVRLVLLLPESDYNRKIGVFQVVADLVSANGNVTARMSQPCMLRFRSLPIRLMHTFLLSVPLLIGLTSEAQKMIVPILKHKEKRYQRTEAIKVTLIPRPGTNFVPQIYEAEIILNSKLPWKKEFVRRWKWTLCIWASLYIYAFLVLVLLCFFRQVIFPRVVGLEQDEDRVKVVEKEVADDGRESEKREDREVREMLRRWRCRRSKRKATMLFDGGASDTIGPSAASSMSITREETLSDSDEFGEED